MGTWHGDPDDAAARLIAEHGMVAGMTGDDLVTEAGNEALLPPWPPTEVVSEHGGTSGNGSPVGSQPTSRVRVPHPSLCAVCATPVKLHGDAGWRHELGYRETGGCTYPVAGGLSGLPTF